MFDSRSGGPIPKVISIVVVTILLAFIHHAATADAAESDNTKLSEERIRHRNNLVTTTGITPTTYLVSFSDKPEVVVATAKQCAALAKSIGGTVRHIYQHVFKGCALTLPATAGVQAQSLAYTALSNYPIVETVELDQPIFLADDEAATTWGNNNIFDSTSYQYDLQASAAAAVAPSWGLDRINQCTLPLDNSVTKQNAADVKVYIIDTGIYAEHNEFANGVIVPENDCHLSVFSEDNPLTDGNGHGTHVAGIACGAKYGVSSNCTLCSVKVLNDAGKGTVGGTIQGIDHAVSQCSSSVDSVGSLCVINLSLGINKTTGILDTAVTNAVSKGVVVVVAAGNANVDACTFSPAGAASVITVGSTAITDMRSSFSNWGSCVDVYAPCSNITSAWNSFSTAAARASGTSMAGPHVTGIAAALRSSNPTWNTTQIRDAIVNSAAALPSGIYLATVDDINCARVPSPPPRIPTYSPTVTSPPTSSTPTISAEPTFNPTSTGQPTSETTNSAQPTVFPSSTHQPTSSTSRSVHPTLYPTTTGEPTSSTTHSSAPTIYPTITGQPTSIATYSAQPTFAPTSTHQPTTDATHSAQPTFLTSTVKPSSSPTSPTTTCTSGTDVEVKVTTDKFPLETSWTLTHKCGVGAIINSPEYTVAFTDHSTKLCLPRCSSYKFTISDSYGDGLCCTWGNGGYAILVDGSSVHSGGEFLESETKLFDAPTDRPSLRPSYSPTTTTYPSFKPTISFHPTPYPTISFQPTLYPTSTTEPTFFPTGKPSPTPTPCTSGTDIEIEVLTDNFPQETAWTLSHKCGAGATINSPPYTDPSTMHSTKVCLPSCLAYKFTITDSWGDGICCGSSGDGRYEILVDGRSVHSGGAFLWSDTFFFKSATNPPSSRPSSAVTDLPSFSPSLSNRPTLTPTSDQPTFTPTSIQPTSKPTSSNQPTTSIPTSTQPTFTPTSLQPTSKPTSTDQPTNSIPTSTQPTAKPTNSEPATTSCTNGGTDVEVKIMTDKFPSETAWTISHKCGTTGATMTSPKYTAALSMHSTKLCLPSCSSYKFTISDSHGDGLCCKWGRGQYEIRVDGSIVQSGGEFFGSETKIFGPMYDKSKLALKDIWSRKKHLRPIIDAKSTKNVP